MANKRNRERGSALIFALLLILVISVMGTSLMFLSQSETWSSMNYRMMSQSRYGAESGLSLASDYISNQYTAPTDAGVDVLTNYKTDVSPVLYNGQPVVLSSVAGKSNYPVGTVVTAFQNAVNNPGYVTAGNTRVNYAATAELLSMGKVNSFGNPITVQMWRVTTQGTINGARGSTEQVSAILERQVSPSTIYAAFATANGCSSLKFSGGGTTNSYNSQLLTLNASGAATASPTFNTYGGNVGSNGNLAENGSKTTIYGTMSSPDTGVGNCSGGNVTAWTNNGNATVSGPSGCNADPSCALVKLPQIVTFPTPVIPNPGTATENVSSGNLTTSPVTCGTTLGPWADPTNYNAITKASTYGDISLSGHGVLCLQPGTYDINSLSATGANTGIVIVPNPNTGVYAPITLNVAGTNPATSNPINLGGNGFENPTLNPALLQINYAGTGTISLNGNTQSAAVIYAPNATVNLTGGSDFYGAVIGNVVNDAGGTAIHYDLNLANSSFIVSNFMLDSFNWEKF